MRKKTLLIISLTALTLLLSFYLVIQIWPYTFPDPAWKEIERKFETGEYKIEDDK